jgi:hypothetical protein
MDFWLGVRVGCAEAYFCVCGRGELLLAEVLSAQHCHVGVTVNAADWIGGLKNCVGTCVNRDGVQARVRVMWVSSAGQLRRKGRPTVPMPRLT